MAHRLRWSNAALADVAAIAEFIARDSERYSRTVARKLLGAGRMLRDFPFSGRAVTGATERTLREISVDAYRVIYRVNADSVTIVAVVHGKRLLPKNILPDPPA